MRIFVFALSVRNRIGNDMSGEFSELDAHLNKRLHFNFSALIPFNWNIINGFYLYFYHRNT